MTLVVWPFVHGQASPGARPWTRLSGTAALGTTLALFVDDLFLAFGSRGGARRLWPGFTLDDQCFVLQGVFGRESAFGPALLALGRCGEDGAVLVRPVSLTPSMPKARSAVVVSGEALGLNPGVSAILFSLPSVLRSEDEALDLLLFVVHEAFHLNYQMRRVVNVPGERALQSWMADPYVGYKGTARHYLELEYPRREGVAALLKRERVYLRVALASAGAERASGRYAETAAAIDAVFGLMADRTALGGRLEVSEASWELDEGVATNLERRALEILEANDRAAGAIRTRILKSDVDDAAGLVIPFFIVSGALKAALLDEIAGWEAWPPLVHPGRSGEGRSLNEVLLFFRNRIQGGAREFD